MHKWHIDDDPSCDYHMEVWLVCTELQTVVCDATGSSIGGTATDVMPQRCLGLCSCSELIPAVRDFPWR